MSYVLLAVIEPGMDTNDEVRRRRLARLCKETEGGLQAVAEKAGQSWAHLDQIMKRVLLPAKSDGSSSARALGDRAARQIEVAHKLPPGWLDWPLEAVDYARYMRLSDLDKGAVQTRMMAAIELAEMSTNADFPENQESGKDMVSMLSDNSATSPLKRKGVTLASSQPDPKIPKGANLGVIGSSGRAKSQKSNAGNKATRVQKQGNNRNA